MLDKTKKLFIAGHRGMVGGALLRKFQNEGFTDIITRTRQQLDLCNKNAVTEFFKIIKPDYVILAAAKVGGIKANSEHKAEFLLENLEIQNNVIYQAYLHGVKKFCFLGSSCIYPYQSPQPIKEEYLLTGPLEPTNEGYALAKIAGYKLGCYLAQQYGFNAISAMPCNLYGQGDNFDYDTSHVLSALVRRFCDAVINGDSEVVCWGSGTPRREFLNVDDMADAVYFLMNNYNQPEFVNVGSGADIGINDLAELIAKNTGFTGKIKWDTTRPDGMKLKCMDVSKITKLGWQPTISLENGIKALIEEYRSKV